MPFLAPYLSSLAPASTEGSLVNVMTIVYCLIVASVGLFLALYLFLAVYHARCTAAFIRNVSEWLRTDELLPEGYDRLPPTPSMQSINGFSGVDVTDPNSYLALAARKLPSETYKEKKRSPAEIDALLRPTDDAFDMAYRQAYETWHRFLIAALDIGEGCLPFHTDPSVMIYKAPCLPVKMPPTKTLFGSSTWSSSFGAQTPPILDPTGRSSYEYVGGPLKHYRLSYDAPLECAVEMSPSAFLYPVPGPIKMGPSKEPSSLAILTLAWSYIFSASLLERQDIPMQYTNSYLQPRRKYVDRIEDDEVAILLDDRASPKLVRWLCALLAPTPGWRAQPPSGGEHYPPWAASLLGNVKIVIVTDESSTFDVAKMAAPSGDDAMELLLELNHIHGLGYSDVTGFNSMRLSPLMAGFYAAMAIPFYRRAKLQPVFPPPALGSGQQNALDTSTICIARACYVNLGFYMSVSMHPETVGSILWSIFWTPDIECNLVSAWLAGAGTVLRKAASGGDLDLLVRIFIARRPRIGLWWLGLCLLGSPKVFDLIENYLNKLDEGLAYGTMSCPDMAAAQWVGADQSFLDRARTPVDGFTTNSDPVKREDVVRQRVGLTMRNAYPLAHGWKPFGTIAKGDIERELWPWLAYGQQLQYAHWNWWLSLGEAGDTFKRLISSGFAKETVEKLYNVEDHVLLLPLTKELPLIPVPPGISQEPSIQATRQMMAQAFGEVGGQRCLENTGFDADVMEHEWLRGWFTLENTGSDHYRPMTPF